MCGRFLLERCYLWAPYELNPTQLMRATMLSSGGMTKRLDRMAEAGLVERRADPDDAVASPEAVASSLTRFLHASAR